MHHEYLGRLDDIRRRACDLQSRGQLDEARRRTLELEMLERLFAIAKELARRYTHHSYCIRLLPRSEQREEFVLDRADLAVPLWRNGLEVRHGRPFFDAFLEGLVTVVEFSSFVDRLCDSERKKLLRRLRRCEPGGLAIEVKADTCPFNDPIKSTEYGEQIALYARRMWSRSRLIFGAVREVSTDERDQRALRHYIKSVVRQRVSRRGVARRFGITVYRLKILIGRFIKALDGLRDDLCGCDLRARLAG